MIDRFSHYLVTTMFKDGSKKSLKCSYLPTLPESGDGILKVHHGDFEDEYIAVKMADVDVVTVEMVRKEETIRINCSNGKIRNLISKIDYRGKNK